MTAAVASPPSAFALDLARLERDIASLGERRRRAALDPDGVRSLAYRHLQRASLTGEFADLALAEAAIVEGLEVSGRWPDLWLARANLDFRLHRLDAVRRDLAMLDGLAVDSQATALRADLCFQTGQYDAARRGYEAAIEEDPTWANLARLAHFVAKMGDVDEAHRLYARAADEITAKEMRSYAWVELQRGLLELQRGRYDEASVHYSRATRAYSGFWTCDEHVAELLAATGRFDDAVALYLDVISRVSRPELKQALGDLYAFVGDHVQSERWRRAARGAFLESAERGEVHYLHHLADVCADLGETADAVVWARRDLDLRANYATQAALAWALHRDGQSSEAAELVERALQSGVRDARLLRTAATVYAAAGRADEGGRLGRAAVERDPRHMDFRAHR